MGNVTKIKPSVSERELKTDAAGVLLDIGYYASEGDVKAGETKRAFYSIQDGESLNVMELKHLRMQANLAAVAFDMLGRSCSKLLGEIDC